MAELTLPPSGKGQARRCSNSARKMRYSRVTLPRNAGFALPDPFRGAMRFPASRGITTSEPGLSQFVTENRAAVITACAPCKSSALLHQTGKEKIELFGGGIPANAGFDKKVVAGLPHLVS